MLLIDKIRIFDHLLEQHVNEAAYLWSQRDFAVDQVMQPAAFIRKQELRIQRHLQGLLVSPAHSWDVAVQAASEIEAGGLFVLAYLAFHQGDARKIEQVLALAQQNPASFNGLASALGWLGDAKVHPFLQPWITSESPWLRYLSLVVCSLRRLDPRDYLGNLLRTAADNLDDPATLRALRLAGEIKRHDVLPLLQALSGADPTPAHYWSHRTRLLLGDATALEPFEYWLLQPGPLQTGAIDLAVRSHTAQTHLPWLKKLSQLPGQAPQLIIALAALGDPQHINWLLERMAQPTLAPLAGYAFSTITGVDLTDAGLTKRFSPDEEEFDIDRVDDDWVDDDCPAGYTQLPIPDGDLVKRYWSRHAHQFTSGQGYLAGRPKTREWMETQIRGKTQGQRQAAALELAFMEAQRPLTNIKRPEVHA